LRPEYNGAMIYVLIITIIIVAVSVLLLGIKVFFTKNGKFPNTHVGGNAALKKRGITCIKEIDNTF